MILVSVKIRNQHVGIITLDKQYRSAEISEAQGSNTLAKQE